MQTIWKKISTTPHAKSHHHYVHIIDGIRGNERPIIKIENLSVGYKNWTKTKFVLEDIDLQIYPNEIIALLGSNGAGKSTLINAIVGVIKYQKGEIELDNTRECMNEFIGVQFQDLKFPQGLTVKDMINFQINMLNTPVAIDLLQEMLTCFQLHEMLNKQVHKLSGGQQQRLNVLLALITKPKVLILDEYTTGLDIASKNDITEYIYNFAKTHRISIILISHDIYSIDKLAERFIVLANKRVVVDTTRKTILNKFKTVDNFLAKYIK